MVLDIKDTNRQLFQRLTAMSEDETVLRIIKTKDGSFEHRVLMKLENYSDDEMVLLKAEVFNLISTMSHLRFSQPKTIGE